MNRDGNGRFVKGHVPTKRMCDKMSKSHTGLKRSDATKDKISKNNARYWKGKQLSASTREKMSKARYRGLTPILRTIRRTGRYQRWMKMCLDRDEYTCQICRVKREELHVHHIIQLHKHVKYYDIKGLEDIKRYEYGLFNANNGMTLCKTCHGAVHHGHY